MKVCSTCGTTLGDNDVFCPNCGSNVPASNPNASYPPAAPQMYTKQPISVGGWIGRSLIPFIPVVGGLVYLIMLFVWSGDTTKEDTFRNWAKAELIVMAIVLVMTILIAAIFGVALAEAFESIEYMY